MGTYESRTLADKSAYDFWIASNAAALAILSFESLILAYASVIYTRFMYDISTLYLCPGTYLHI